MDALDNHEAEQESEQWTALQREAALASDHLAAGVMALEKANYAAPGKYHLAFFALSVGLERTGKLALLLGGLVATGVFPAEKAIRSYQHRLRDILDDVEATAKAHQLTEQYVRLPREPIHDAVISILHEFASNVTRYYNIDVLMGSQQGDDPVKRWYTEVTLPAFAQHVPQARKNRIAINAAALHAISADVAAVIHTGEGGEKIDTFFDASTRTGIAVATQPFVRMYVLQLHRFVGSVITALCDKAHMAGHEIPYMSEFFGRFCQDDAEFRRRKTW